MKPICIYDPDPKTNEYLSSMYFSSIYEFCSNVGIPISYASSLDYVFGSFILIHGDRLSPSVILTIKNNRNTLVVFDINDSSYFSSAYHNSEETLLIDLIFKVSGIPKTNFTLDPSIDRNFGITSSEVRYLPDDQWSKFESLNKEGKIKPLPYVLWNPVNKSSDPVKSYSERSGKVLVRGGNHFWRVVLFMRLMQEGLDDPNCKFATADYFTDTMVERFRYCEACVSEKKEIGKCAYDTIHDHLKCKSPASWGVSGEMFGGPAFGRNEFGWWNNRCPASFFWLAKEYEKNRGPLNHERFEDALNGSMEGFDKFIGDVEGASFYADLKWLNTIYAPPRFWEAAALGTVNFYPKRTSDQDYFPIMTEGDHYLTFPDDLSSFEMPDEKTWNHVSSSAKDLYETWIRGDKYKISTNLLKHIVDAMKEIE